MKKAVLRLNNIGYKPTRARAKNVIALRRQQPKGKRGRPKGSKDKVKRYVHQDVIARRYSACAERCHNRTQHTINNSRVYKDGPEYGKKGKKRKIEVALEVARTFDVL